MTGPNFWPPQQVPPQQVPARRTGVPAWAGTLAALALIAGAWFGAGAIVPADQQAAPGTKTAALPSSATPTGVDSGLSVSTATRPPQAILMYPDPLPQALQPAGNPQVAELKTDSAGNFRGIFEQETAPRFSAWVTKLKGAGFTPSPGQKNDSMNFDLSKGHARILGSFLASPDTANSATTFAYDENGA